MSATLVKDVVGELADAVEVPAHPEVTDEVAPQEPKAAPLTLTVLVPAFNEEKAIGVTLESLREQTLMPTEIIVVDDASTDKTPEILRDFVKAHPEMPITVLRPPANLGSKAKAQNFALPHVTTDLVLPLDGDTKLAPDYIELLLPVFKDQQVSVASGCVLTQKQETIWEKARQLEYLLGFHFFRSVQQMARSVTVCSGCCTVFRAEHLTNGFPETTLTEDIFYTWEQHIARRRAVYVPEAVAYAAEPDSLKFMSKQLKRWKCGWFHGFRMQYLRLLRNRPMVALWAGLQFLDTTLAPLVMAMPVLMYFIWDTSVWHILEWWFIGDAVTFWPPVLYGCWRRKYSPIKAILSYPAWYALKLLNFRWDMHMLVRELILVPLRICKPFTTYERGKE